MIGTYWFLVQCFGKRLTAKQAQRVAHPPPPAADDGSWQPAPTAPDAALQLGPRQTALCGNGTSNVLVGQKPRGPRWQECCTGGTDCDGRAAEYSFFDTQCALAQCCDCFIACGAEPSTASAIAG